MAQTAAIPANDTAPARGAAMRRRERPRALKYHAFLSYSHRDQELADWLHEELEGFRVPAKLVGRLGENGPVPRRLTPIFRDEQELPAAGDLGEEIEAALASTRFLIVLCSPAAAKSRWTNAEIAAFKRSRPDGCILAAIAEGEPFASELPGREDEECFPPALRQKYDRRGRPTGRRAEPLAADLRGGAEERRVGFLKLVAGMLGVGLDELVQRETTQRHRRLAWLAAASLAGMAVTSGLAITAIQARDAARDQRREAEGLVAFMLGDLRDKLEPIGKLDALDGVGAKVLQYYHGQDASQLSDAGLVQRSQALSLSAQVAYQRGKLAVADKLYAEALRGTAEAIRRKPDDPQRLFDHAQNVFYAAEIASDQGDLPRAERGFRVYESLAHRMTALQPDNLKWRMEVQYAEVNLGYVLLRQRRFADAASQFSKALATIQTVAALDPANTDYQLETAENLAWLADAEIARGNLIAAINARRRQVALIQKLMLGSADVTFRQKLVPAEEALGRLLAASGNGGAAQSLLNHSASTADELLSAEPANGIWLNYAASAHFAVAVSALGRGDVSAATAHLERGCALSVQQMKIGDLGAKAATNLWTCAVQGSRIALAQNQAGEALNKAKQAIELATNVHSPDHIGVPYLIANSLLAAGDAYARDKQEAAARALWQQGLSRAAGGPDQPWERATRADLLERLGRRDEASAIRQGIRRAGIVNVEILRS